MALMAKVKSLGWLQTIVIVWAVLMIIYQVSGAFYLLVDQLENQNFHLAFSLVLVALIGWRKSARFWPLRLASIILALGVAAYIQINYQELFYRLGFNNTLDTIVGATLIILVLVASIQCFGVVLPIFTAVVLAYGFFGQYLPPPYKALVYPPLRMIGKLSMLEGIYGTILGISAEYIFLFMIFGAALVCSGANRFFLEVGKAFGRKLRGGGALTAVIGSSLVGMITGSVTANILTVGPFTIPLMKKLGYQPHQAAAIEAAASTGGQIMPPVMGAAIFLMVGFTGIPYFSIMLAAAIPAILYYLSVGLYVQFQAVKYGIARVTEPVNTRELLLNAPTFVLPLILLVVLLGLGFSPEYAVVRALFAIVAISMIRKGTRGSWASWIKGLTEGAETGAQIGVVCGLLGIVVTVFDVTGLGSRLPVMLESLSGGNMTVLLAICMVTAIILGCGMTTPAVYVLVAVVIAPVLVRMGLTPMQAHLFIFYYACLNFVTPPVAIGALVAAKMAEASYFKSAMEATKVVLGALLVPFLFVWFPILVLQPQSPLSAILGIATAVGAILAAQVAICNCFVVKLNQVERVLYSAVAIFLMVFSAMRIYSLIAAALVFLLLLVFWQWQRSRQLKLAPSQLANDK